MKKRRQRRQTEKGQRRQAPKKEKASSALLMKLCEEIPVVARVLSDYRATTFSAAMLSIILNAAFAAFDAFQAYRSHSPWIGTLAAYYFVLGGLRAAAVLCNRKDVRENKTDQMTARDIALYQSTSISLIFMAWILAGAVILLFHSEGGKQYSGYLIYVVAIYTFYKITMAVLNLVKAGRLRSPLLVTVRRLNYADACVSVLFLQTAMFRAFDDSGSAFPAQANALTGAIVCAMVLSLGVWGIVSAKKWES